MSLKMDRASVTEFCSSLSLTYHLLSLLGIFIKNGPNPSWLPPSSMTSAKAQVS